MDLDLVRRAQRGDTRALNEVLDQLMPYVGRICAAVALDDGEDAMQDALVAIVRHLPGLREPEALWSWSRRIAVREAVRVARRRGRAGTPTDPAGLAELDARLRHAGHDETVAVDVRMVLGDLPPEQRAVLVLRHLEDASEAEVAETLIVAPGTVKSRVLRPGRLPHEVERMSISVWPDVTLDPIARLRVLSRALGGLHVAECELDMAYDRFWPWLMDFEHSIPSFDRSVWRARVLQRTPTPAGEHVRLRAWPVPLAFDVDIREGWCWMAVPGGAVVMAAMPDGPDRTRYAMAHGIVAKGPAWLQRAQRPLLWASRRVLAHHSGADLDGIARQLLTRFPKSA